MVAQRMQARSCHSLCLPAIWQRSEVLERNGFPEGDAFCWQTSPVHGATGIRGMEDTLRGRQDVPQNPQAQP
jgi:hypothetical protein